MKKRLNFFYIDKDDLIFIYSAIAHIAIIILFVFFSYSKHHESYHPVLDNKTIIDVTTIEKENLDESIKSNDIQNDKYIDQLAQRIQYKKEQAIKKALLKEKELAKQELAKQELAKQELAKQELAKQELAKQELAKQELAKQELAKQELAKQELAKQELAKQELAKQELAKQELAKQELAKNKADIALKKYISEYRNRIEKSWVMDFCRTIPPSDLPIAFVKKGKLIHLVGTSGNVACDNSIKEAVKNIKMPVLSNKLAQKRIEKGINLDFGGIKN